MCANRLAGLISVKHFASISNAAVLFDCTHLLHHCAVFLLETYDQVKSNKRCFLFITHVVPSHPTLPSLFSRPLLLSATVFLSLNKLSLARSNELYPSRCLVCVFMFLVMARRSTRVTARPCNDCFWILRSWKHQGHSYAKTWTIHILSITLVDSTECFSTKSVSNHSFVDHEMFEMEDASFDIPKHDQLVLQDLGETCFDQLRQAGVMEEVCAPIVQFHLSF